MLETLARPPSLAYIYTMKKMMMVLTLVAALGTGYASRPAEVRIVQATTVTVAGS